MLILEIQDNIIKSKNSLRRFETSIIYKSYKTLGGMGKFEQEVRNIHSILIGLRNSFISHAEAIIRLSENKDLLTLIDTRYFERYSDAVSVESLVRIASFHDFKIPETSLQVIAENKKVVTEMQAINQDIQSYNNLITTFRQKRNKYHITLYRVPKNDELPNVIEGSVNIEGLLPNAEVLSTFATRWNINEPKKTIISIQPKKEVDNVKKESGTESKKIKIIKK